MQFEVFWEEALDFEYEASLFSEHPSDIRVYCYI